LDNTTEGRTPVRLTAKQVEEVRAPSVKYPEDAYAAELDRILKARKPEGRIEEKFPGVKPAHVAHMLKQLRPEKAKVDIVMHGAYGVCVLPAEKDGNAAG
jgi:hypothetical protein